MKKYRNAENTRPSLTNIFVKVSPRVRRHIGIKIIKSGIGIIHNVALRPDSYLFHSTLGICTNLSKPVKRFLQGLGMKSW